MIKKNVVKLTVSLVAFIAELLIRLMSMEESGKTNNFMKSSVMTGLVSSTARTDLDSFADRSTVRTY